MTEVCIPYKKADLRGLTVNRMREIAASWSIPIPRTARRLEIQQLLAQAVGRKMLGTAPRGYTVPRDLKQPAPRKMSAAERGAAAARNSAAIQGAPAPLPAPTAGAATRAAVQAPGAATRPRSGDVLGVGSPAPAAPPPGRPKAAPKRALQGGSAPGEAISTPGRAGKPAAGPATGQQTPSPSQPLARNPDPAARTVTLSPGEQHLAVRALRYYAHEEQEAVQRAWRKWQEGGRKEKERLNYEDVKHQATQHIAAAQALIVKLRHDFTSKEK